MEPRVAQQPLFDIGNLAIAVVVAVELGQQGGIDDLRNRRNS